MVRVSKKPQERRNELLDAAMQLFNEKGYEQTSVSDIVKKVGVAQGTFYYHFKSKDEMVNAACERALAVRIEEVEKTVEHAQWGAPEKLTRIFTEAFPPERDEAMFDYLHKEDNSSLHQKWIVAEIQALIPYVKKIVRQGVEEGSFTGKQPEVAMEFLLVGASFWLDRGIFPWSEEEYQSKRQSMAAIIDQLLGGERIFSEIGMKSPKQVD
ncbi:TetR/AcrR family transcriptional regulator [Paenibacillus monticola]|uniref:TetR family transcriptional regulator n=1 Tax=Paenibacillus monticola TaxID=2666075 RepID=A0A7X2H489_9BACL|nr:TetR/AcrR family transcriptional regulator [Paenibacillus monticola]MRN53237.1 TetR family transcriptional regulator [Paenibacillus monticola]